MREGVSRRFDAAARRAALVGLVLACLTPPVPAQVSGRVSFSMEWHGPTVGDLSSTPGTPMTEGDILLPGTLDPAFGPLPKPQIFRNGGQLGISRYAQCVGHQGGTPCGVEVDALSYGTDGEFRCDSSDAHLYFSVDEQAVGFTGSVLSPSVRSETATGVRDVSADIFVSVDLPPGPLPPSPAPVRENVATIDGDGLTSGSGAHYRGVGLTEPNPPGSPPDPGDNLDALDLSPLPTQGSIYFSLDAAFNDPALPGVSNSGSAAFAGVAAAAVLKAPVAGGAFTVYATPSQLGLDHFGAGTDDLDGLILAENGDGIFQPSLVPCDWVAPGPLLGGPTDMLLFSVRRGSAVIGMPDSIFGAPIAPGDVLTTPLAGGGSPFPGIYIAAEHLGLATTRTDGASFGGDEMDAMGSRIAPFYDCNNNGVEDSVDIATGSSADANGNGIPDDCEQSWNRYCLCGAGLGPCGNDDATAGCENSTGVGASLDASGTSSFDSDDLVLTASLMPTNKLALWVLSSTQAQAPLGDGLRCIGSPFKRFGTFNTGVSGSGTKGPGIIESSCLTLPPAYCIDAGSTWNFQVWYRNMVGSPCGGGSNLTNGLEVTFTP